MEDSARCQVAVLTGVVPVLDVERPAVWGNCQATRRSRAVPEATITSVPSERLLKILA